ncbi:WD repeat- and FYVE domain-containing protein 4 isoform X1 [Zootoca vivipara]|uniref:WD repeat- and FYVE domain-containing protein 4 isoform X1 n=1 Tax=Zootoca vivipara TaxID=8524 RepID=UPI00293BC307|nr:WD repeat- and FYVE domain-containing protein 4 isoform X1 [Zootoca vivipara]XP_060131097.1 WD repeat- and FYVE domain-containing protein 4 isoform X1 [Zootoca vivipara]
MEAELEFPKQLEEDSPDKNAGQDQTQTEPAELSKKDPSECPPFLWETLSKQFMEYGEMDPAELQSQLLTFLPIFLKAWDQSAGNICFPNTHLLASETSKLLAKEIKKKLNGKPAGEAQLAVWQFLQRKEEEEPADGYVLLRSVYLLSLDHMERGTRWNIIKSGLPVALFQCLYFFFAFPLEEAGGKTGMSQAERQAQEMFVQTMLNIYAEEQGVEELLTATDLQSLIIATASFWDRGSPSWKGPTSHVLRTISKAQSRNTISYLQAMDCIKISVQNLSKLADSLSPRDVCEAVNIILCFVRDSYLISPALLLEFENNGGYQLLLKVFLRYEGLLSSKEDASVKEMLDFLAQLTVCGKTELKVSGNITPPQLPQFSAKQSPSPGNTVKNLKAFQVLESLFRKSSNAELCRHILLSLKDIWTWNPMNFFLLEWSLQPISQFVGIIPRKPTLVQRQFFQLVESLVLDLSYTPHEILKDIQGLIKESPDPLCTSLALRCLHNITQRDLLFTDIFRDSGLLGMLLAQLRKEAKILRKKGGNQSAYQDQAMERELTNRTLKLVAALTGGSVRNTVVLRDYGMVPYIKIFIDDELYRNDTLTILEHLSIINPEEYMSIMVGALCSSTQGELNFKLDLLKSLLRTLDNPKGRSAFRTSSGFNGLLSLLADMEGALQDPPSSLWAPFGPSHIMELVLHILQAIAAAIYSDAVNGDFFQKNGLFDKMAEELGSLGCFSEQKRGQIPVQLRATRLFAEFSNAAVSSPESFPTWLKSCVMILNFLDNMARRNPFELKSYLVDMKPGVDQVPRDVKENKPEETEDNLEHVGENRAPADLQPEFKDRLDAEDWAIVCPGALCVMVKLICKLYNEAHPELSWEIQYAVANHIQSLMKMEKNRQVACGAGMLNALVASCLEVLHNDNNPLHLPLIRLFEKLASQSIEPSVLRQFLCLRTTWLPVASGPGVSPPTTSLCRRSGSCHASWNEGSEVTIMNGSPNLHRASLGSDASWISNSSAVALQAAMSLVSMTTPRSLDSHHACLAPSFVEFDMSLEGYGCLFLPALSTVLGPNAESSILGGTGKGPRPFPPLDGLTFSSWFLVSKLGSVHSGHPLRFLTLVRHMARTEEEFVCFAVSFSPVDGCLTISTEEVTFQALDMMEPEFGDLGRSSALSQVQFRCANLLVTRQWHHLAVTVAKETKQTCTTSAYVNGQRVGSAKMHYIQPLPGSFVSMDPSSFIDVYGYVATPRIWKQKSSLTWCQGPMHLFEEALSVGTLQRIASLGPRYCSNFQAVGFKGASSCSSVLTAALVAQEKISFGINVMNSSYTTIKNIKDFYGEVDGRLIAKELELSSRDSTTPVFMSRNTAGKLAGPLRTIGSVAVGLYGTRVFQSCPAAVSLNYIGGPAIMLGLLAMAHDDHTVYAAVKVLHSVLCSSAMSENLMRQIGGYQLLAYLLKRKIHLLNSRILQLVFAIAGITEISLEAPTIKNLEAFQHIVCCFELWCRAPENMEISLFEHLTEILQTSRKGSWNMKLAHRVQMVPRLFILFSDPEITRPRIGRICTVLSHLLRSHFSIKDIDWVGLFLVYTLYPSSVDESHTCPDSEDGLGQTSGKMIWLRNQLLRMLLDMMRSDQLCFSSEIQEEVFQTLGPDWFMMFTQSHLHPSTVVLAVKFLLHFLHNRTLLHKFKEGMMAGLWLENSSAGLNLLMDNLKSCPHTPEYNPYLLPGFAELKTFLSKFVHVPEIYFLLSGLFLATPVFEPPDETKADLDSMLQWLLYNHCKDAVARVGLCPEGAVLLLEMVKSIVKQAPADTEDSWEITYPGHTMQFIYLVYHKYSEDPLWYNSDFLQALALVIFPSAISQGRISPSDSLVTDSDSKKNDAFSASLHPARKQVWDFLRLLLMEKMLVFSAERQWHPLELLLEASEENATAEQKRCFQTELLLSIIDIFYIIGQDDGEASNTQGNGDAKNVSESAVPSFLVNISYFTQKLVEKLYAGMFAADPRKVILFLAEQVIVVTEKGFLHKEAVLSILYSSLNRAILFYLSTSLPDQQRLLSVLQTLQQQWDVIFATHNSSLDFTICLLYCLLQLRPMSDPENYEAKQRAMSYSRIFLEGRMDDNSALKNVQQDIWKATEAIWIQLLSQRRKDLEDAYKMSLSTETADSAEQVKMTDMSPFWEEIMRKAWRHYLASEKKFPQSKVPAQPSDKPRSWSGSLSSAVKLTPSQNLKQTGYKMQDFASRLEEYRRSGQELYALLCKDHAERLMCGYNKSAKAWADLEEQLFRRGGPWASALAPSTSRWILDGYEGPSRMRKRVWLRVTYHTAVSTRNKLHNSSARAHQPQDRTFAVTPDESPGEPRLNGREGEMDCGQLTFFPALHESFQSEEFLEMCTERKIILQEFVQDEKITCRQSVVVVQGHIVLEGALLFGQEHFYICKNFTVSPLGEVYCTKHCITSIGDTFIHSLCDKDQATGQATCSCHSYSDIKEIHPMCFLLQEIALEIFFRSGYSIFLVFHNSDRTKTLKRFYSKKPNLKSKGITEASINIRRSAGREKTMLLKWQRREISNFDYLMYLNTLAGRTYSDLMQYPVFPWVLADYHSQTLDLTNPSTFRDFAKPMGAQTRERKRKFLQRYEEVEKSEGNLSAQCHYCTHYSSAIIVASYLVRMEPFNQIFCSLQGGGFDVAERMFHSMKSTWDSASRDNMTDVRELIPEFFYLPEFLTNCNQFALGSLQDGTSLGDVLLPPWAEGSPHKFISLHRQALESDYVSNHIHHWIDLIFGYKQRGPTAVKAVNVFHPYFYGDQVHPDSISDPLIKNTVLGFVSNFGQIPKQLFTKPHPARNALGKHTMSRDSILFSQTASQLLPTLNHLRNLKPSSIAVKEAPQGPVGHIVCTEKGTLAVGGNKILIPPQWNKVFCWGFDDFTCCLAASGSDKKVTTFEATADWGVCLCAVCPTPTTLITSGSSSVLCVWELSVARGGDACLNLKQPLYGHTQPVTCLAASTSYSIIVSGSADRSCIIWDLNQLTPIAQLPAHEACLSAVAINDSTGDIASCAGTALYLWNVNGQPLATATFSPGATISCCCFMEVMDWDVQSLIVTGDTGGAVKVWKVENNSHPCQDISMRSQNNSSECQGETGNKVEKPFTLCLEMNLSMTPSERTSKTIPAVTALAVSRNYSKLLAGDDTGKLFCWSVDE